MAEMSLRCKGKSCSHCLNISAISAISAGLILSARSFIVLRIFYVPHIFLVPQKEQKWQKCFALQRKSINAQLYRRYFLLFLLFLRDNYFAGNYSGGGYWERVEWKKRVRVVARGVGWLSMKASRRREVEDKGRTS